MTVDFDKVECLIESIQVRTSSFLDQYANLKWKNDKWIYTKGLGGGLTKIAKDKLVIEKAAVNFSSISSEKMLKTANLESLNIKDASFKVCGCSIIIHPHNPYVPTTHANFRFFYAVKPNKEIVWWFGGGFDLTPYYPFEQDCIFWHRSAKQVCDKYGPLVYKDYKLWCDKYFFLPHRNEPRGIGGVFFDNLSQWGFDCCLQFITDLSSCFLESYFGILDKRMSHKYSNHENAFKNYRRGRYVEFNLLHDRGTKFGIDSGGRTDSILASLPPSVTWDDYGQYAEDEKKLMMYLMEKNWV